MDTVFIFFLLVVSCNGARILGLVPYNGKSHWVVMEPLFQELAARGHQVTVYSTFPQKKPLPNYTDVDFSAQLPSLISQFSLDLIKLKMPNPWMATFFLNEIHEGTCKIIKESAFQNLLKSKDQFDLLITELFGSDCYAFFAHKLKIPLISFTTSMSMPWAAERLGLPDNPSYIPNQLVDFSPNMNLWERIYNTIVLIHAKFWHLYIFSKQTHSQTEKSFGEPLPPVGEVVANTSLVFVNSYLALSQSRPFPPNVIEVGGIHIKKRQPLSEDLQSILDAAKNGVIVMSFGSLVRSSTIPKSIIMMFMNVFSTIPQTVIFKYEEDLPEAPPNVVIRKWLPQRDIIEHENVVALIVHGGLASTIEAVYFRKPIVGIPLFTDQRHNINSVVRRGAGVQLDLEDLSEEKIAAAVLEIVNNPKYSENMRRLSLQYRDRPMSPLQTAVYWTEYVIRHQGAPHLRPASVSLPLYQYLLLDVITILLAFLAVLVYLIYFIVHQLYYMISRDKTNTQTQKVKES